MTVKKRYDYGMSLLSVQAQGFGWCFLLLFLSFLIVHIVKLAIIGLNSLGRRRPSEPPEPPPKKETEPVYFLVERTKKRPKTQYSEPKQIHFQ